MSVGSSNSRFKAEVVKALAEVDPRFAQMLRVIKVWSAAHGLNDASNGTFNTFALSLMVRRTPVYGQAYSCGTLKPPATVSGVETQDFQTDSS